MRRSWSGIISIGDFARIVGTEVSTLHYYERVGVMSPAYKTKSGYRCYAAQQIVHFYIIRRLLDAKIPLGDIAAIIQERTPESLLLRSLEMKTAIMDAIRSLNDLYAAFHEITNMLREGLDAIPGKLVVEQRCRQRIVLGPVIDGTSGQRRWEPFSRFIDYEMEQGIEPLYLVGSVYAALRDLAEAPQAPVRFWCADPKGSCELAEARYLVGHTYAGAGSEVRMLPNDCEGVRDIAEKMQVWLREHQEEPKGLVYMRWLHESLSQQDKSLWLAEVFVRLV